MLHFEVDGAKSEEPWQCFLHGTGEHGASGEVKLMSTMVICHHHSSSKSRYFTTFYVHVFVYIYVYMCVVIATSK